MNNYFKGMKDFLVDHIGSTIASSFEVSIDLLPYVGSVIQTMKMNRANRRLSEHAEKLKEIQTLMSYTKLSKEYYEVFMAI